MQEWAADAVTAPGGLMAAEIAEQPAVLERLLSHGAASVRAIAGRIAERQPRFVLLTARGTSDHAAMYAKYLVEVSLGLPAGLSSPSTVTAYGTKPDLSNVLMITVSQSGGSADLIETTRVAREGGATTLSVTNNPDSDLAGVSEFHLDLQAGPERASAATKSYSAELLALWMVVQSIRGGGFGGAHSIPMTAADLLGRRDEIVDISARYRSTDRLVTTGRGYSYPTAREAALKFMETAYIAANAFSGADLLHGPLGMIDKDLPVLAVVPAGRGADAMEPVLTRLQERGADVAVFGSDAAVRLGTVGFRLGAAELSEELHPIVDIVPLQLLALEMGLARGSDPDAPRGLQ